MLNPGIPDNEAIRELRDLVKDLTGVIKQSNTKINKFNKRIFWLTFSQVVFAGIALLLVGYQIFLFVTDVN